MFLRAGVRGRCGQHQFFQLLAEQFSLVDGGLLGKEVPMLPRGGGQGHLEVGMNSDVPGLKVNI